MKKDLRTVLNVVGIVKNSIDMVQSIQNAKKALNDLDLLHFIRCSKYCKTFSVRSNLISYDYAIDEVKILIHKYKKLSTLKNDSEEILTDMQQSVELGIGEASTILDDGRTMITIRHYKEESKARRDVEAKNLFIEWIGINASKYRDAFIKKLNKRYLDDYDKLYIRTGAYSLFTAEKRPERIMVQPEYYEAANILEKFIFNKYIYDEVGAIYKESFLFYGEPGAGKTTAIMVLAARFNANVIKLDLSAQDWKESIYNTNYAWKKGKLSFILIEDIDCYLDIDRKEKSNDDNAKEKKSILCDLFQFMDGSESQPGTVYFLTTNYINKLDKALIRPGRVNNKIEFHNIGRDLQDKMISNFNLSREELDDNTIPEICSPSALATYLLNRRTGIIKPFKEYILSDNESEGNENE